MTQYQIILVAFFALLCVLQVLDVVSTNRFLARGTGHEANSVARWAQHTLGANWWIIKVPVVLAASALWWAPYPWGIAYLFGICGYYVITVIDNFEL